MEVTWKEKINEFYDSMKKRGYEVELGVGSVDPFVYGKLEHIVTKDGYYHVSLKEKLIVEAPLDYLEGLVEREFEILEDKQ